MARLRAEGANTPADMFITVDAGNLWQAEEMGLFRALDSDGIKGNIPSQYRAESGQQGPLSTPPSALILPS